MQWARLSLTLALSQYSHSVSKAAPQLKWCTVVKLHILLQHTQNFRWTNLQTTPSTRCFLMHSSHHYCNLLHTSMPAWGTIKSHISCSPERCWLNPTRLTWQNCSRWEISTRFVTMTVTQLLSVSSSLKYYYQGRVKEKRACNCYLSNSKWAGACV